MHNECVGSTLPLWRGTHGIAPDEEMPVADNEPCDTPDEGENHRGNASAHRWKSRGGRT